MNEDGDNWLTINKPQSLINGRIEMMNSYNEFFSLNGINVLKWLEYKGFNKEIAKTYLNIDKRFYWETDPTLVRYFNNQNDYKEYPLAEAVSLFTEMAKINPFSYKSINNFIKVFGLPFGVHDINHTEVVLGDSTRNSIQYVDYNMLVYKLIEYKLIFDIFKNIVTNDSNYILDRDSVIYSKKHNYYDPSNKSSILENESEYFAAIMNGKEFLQPKVFHNSFNKNLFHLESTYNNLFDYSYYQMVEALIGKSSFKVCEHCEHIFEATHEKMRFCPTLPFRKRSSCEMAYRNNMRKK